MKTKLNKHKNDKAVKATRPYPSTFSLIETLLWENGKFFLLKFHLARLQKSAHYFSYSYNENDIAKSLEDLSHTFDIAQKYRIRLLLEKSGKFNISSHILGTPSPLPVKITLSSKKIDKDDVFLYHKTTNRTLYDTELETWREKGFFDIIFSNHEDEVTEGAITNIIIQKDKKFWTPPLSSGLLNGVYRQFLLKTKKLSVKEKVLYEKDLLNADKIFIVNSVRKVLHAALVK